jgi:bifunctional non-homologous end joining protein LigD
MAAQAPAALTHPERVLWPDIGLTKGGLADYYGRIAPLLLPHVAERPLTLVRCPGGIGRCFFQQHPWRGMHPAVSRGRAAGEEHVVVRDAEGLVALVQGGVVEIHPWGSTLAAIGEPDTLTVDLDPDEAVPFAALAEAAVEVRERLRAAGLEGFLKATGGKGLHVVAPLAPGAGWDRLGAFAEALARAMEADAPGRFTTASAKDARAGRIYVDHLRNGRGATAVAAYSVRARTGAPVAAPLAWDELSPLGRPGPFAAPDLPARVAARGDPWEGWRSLKQRLPTGGS